MRRDDIQISSFAAPTEAEQEILLNLSDEQRKALFERELRKGLEGEAVETAMEEIWQETPWLTGNREDHVLPTGVGGHRRPGLCFSD